MSGIGKMTAKNMLEECPTNDEQRKIMLAYMHYIEGQTPLSSNKLKIAFFKYIQVYV